MLRQLLDTVLPDLTALDCVGFKVVLAKGVSGVQYLTDDVLSKMEAFSSIAPAHNPPYLAAIRQFRALLPDTPLIGAFETAFHRTMPPEALKAAIVAMEAPGTAKAARTAGEWPFAVLYWIWMASLFRRNIRLLW